MAQKIISWTINTRLFSTNVTPTLVQRLSKLKSSKYFGNIEELLSSTPELNRYQPEVWENSFKTLTTIGFPPEKFPYMISQHPRILQKTEAKILNSLNQWYNFDFGEKNTIQLLERYPELLEVDNFKTVYKNLCEVKSFVGQKNGYKVMRNSPNIATDSTKKIEEKITYLRDVMRVDPVEVYKSDVFSHDLFTIKTRHVFLERLGLYFKKKKKDEDEAHQINKNPRLYKITDTSDKRFATKVCHVTLEEYEAFVEMYKKEIEDAEDEFDKPNDYDDNSHIEFSR